MSDENSNLLDYRISHYSAKDHHTEIICYFLWMPGGGDKYSQLRVSRRTT